MSKTNGKRQASGRKQQAYYVGCTEDTTIPFRWLKDAIAHAVERTREEGRCFIWIPDDNGKLHRTYAFRTNNRGTVVASCFVPPAMLKTIPPQNGQATGVNMHGTEP